MSQEATNNENLKWKHAKQKPPSPQSWLTHWNESAKQKATFSVDKLDFYLWNVMGSFNMLAP